MWFFPILATGGATGTTVSPSTGHLVLTGYVATVSQTGNQIVSPATGHLTLTGYVSTVTRTANQSISPATGHLILTGYAPAITQVMTLTLTVQQAARLEAVIRLHGLIDPLVITPTSRSDGTVIQSLSGTGPVTVATTTMPSSGVPTAVLVDKLARWYGLIDPMVEQDASRTDGTLTQTVVTAGTTTTVTTL